MQGDHRFVASQNLDWQGHRALTRWKGNHGEWDIHMRQIVKAARALRAGAAMLALSASGSAGIVAAQTSDVGPDSGGAVVVELYTSQGCSSCPPADVLLEQLATDPRVIALSLHVDYWDYLGWKDKFADPAFTARQKAYARAAGDRMIYTPQMVVGGIDRIVGNDPAAVAATIRAHVGLPRNVRLTLTRVGDRIVIRAVAVPPSDRAFRVQLVRYRDKAVVTIERGENAGLEVTYVNIVTSWEHVADWRASQPFELATPAKGAEGTAVIIQSDGPAEIIAAAVLR